MISWIVLFINFSALFFLALALHGQNIFRGIDAPVFIHVLGFTIFQALLSAVFCVGVGLMAAPGFASLGRVRRVARWALILPNMMSPILVVLCLLLTFKSFPYGIWGILLGHLFMNAGLCTVWLGEAWLDLESRWRPVNDAMGGASKLFFYRKILFPQIFPQIRNTLAVIFTLCLASFAIPLVLGGGPRTSTLEVLIFERIHTDADVASAVVIGLVQCLVQFVVFLLILRPMLLKKEYSRLVLQSRGLSPWSLITWLIVGMSLFPLGHLIPLAFSKQALMSLAHLGGFSQATLISLTVGLSVAVLTFFGLALLTGWGWNSNVVKAPALSGVAVGLSGLLLFRSWTMQSPLPVWAALVWGHITILFLPIFRLCAPTLENLRMKFGRVLDQLGASKNFSFKRVYLKLGFKTYLAGACLAGCWSFGEFSVASMVSPSHPTLPVFIQSLLGSYRLDEASAASLLLLLLSVVSITLLEVLAHGLG